VGAWLQLCLQAVIALTGNYGFFNCLTAALCLPAAANDFDLGAFGKRFPRRPSSRQRGSDRGSSGTMRSASRSAGGGAFGWRARASQADDDGPSRAVAAAALGAATAAAVVWAAKRMVAYEPWPAGQLPWRWADESFSRLGGSTTTTTTAATTTSGGSRGGSRAAESEGGGLWLALSPSELDAWVAWAVPACVAYALGATLVAGWHYATLQLRPQDSEDSGDENAGGGSGGSDCAPDGNRRGKTSGNGRRWARRCGRVVHAVVVTALALAVVTLGAVPLVRACLPLT
jgi:hypothetical protein